MEQKASARYNKKSAASTLDKKKSKRKKNKRRNLLRGTEFKESDIPNPDLESAFQGEGDTLLTDQTDAESISASTVTQLPLLSSQATVSLTTQTASALSSSLTRLKSSSSLHLFQTSLPSATTSSHVITSRTISHTTTASADSVAAQVASLTVKKTSKLKGRNQTPKSCTAKSSRNKDRQQSTSGSNPITTVVNSQLLPKATASTESLRWDHILEDTEKERERIATYKLNRRKRYLTAAQAKGLGWALNYAQCNISPISEDSGVETLCDSPGSFVHFETIRSFRPIKACGGLTETLVEC